MPNKPRLTPVENIQAHRKKRNDRINSGDPKNWNIKDCAKILGTDYLRESYGLKAWIRIAELLNYTLESSK